MTKSIWMAFAEFLQANGYDTKMWERGYTSDEANEVCHRMTTWWQHDLALSGECLMLWSTRDGIRFSGDSELVYALNGTGYLLPNPFLEGDAEGFLVTLQNIAAGKLSQLFATSLRGRVLYNAH